MIAWLFVRILAGYLAAGLLVAFLLHPFVPGWKAAPAALLLALLGLLHTLTTGTELLFRPMHRIYCAVHDAIPGPVRDLYHPVQLEIGLAVLAVLSLYRWTRRIAWKWKLGALAVPLAAALFSHLPTAAAAPGGPPCFVLVATDSLRADHLSCNGYARETTPSIDALAARGTNFANCLVPTASTHESWVSMLSSTEPRENGLRHMFPSRELVARVEAEQAFFPRVARDAGYRTAAIGGWCGTTFRLFDMGFEHVDVSNTQNHRALIAEAALTNHVLAAPFLDNALGRLLVPELERVSFTRSAPSLTAKAKRYIDDRVAAGEPFLLVVVYHVTHLPYSSSQPYTTLFADPAYRGRNRYRIDFDVDEMIQHGFDDDLTPGEKRHIVDLYDGTVREFDDQVGALVGHLQDRGLLGRTVVGVVADHGDDLYEHGTTLGHGVTLFGGDHANQIPAVFAGPGIPARRVDRLVRSFDLAPTWARWLGLDAPARWRGADLTGEVPELEALLETSYLLYRQPVPDLRPGEEVKGFPRFDQATFLDPSFDYNLVLRAEVEPLLEGTKCYAVRSGRWKLISVPGVGGPIHRLFDLEADPQCRRDLAAAEPEVHARLRASLPEGAR